MMPHDRRPRPPLSGGVMLKLLIVVAIHGVTSAAIVPNLTPEQCQQRRDAALVDQVVLGDSRDRGAVIALCLPAGKR
jgi:hypothetical protein